MNREELKSIFDALRNDPQHHLGLGDIRLTIAQQDAILDLFPFKDNPLPPAEGAEEYLKLPQNDGKLKYCPAHFLPILIRLMEGFATLHAQRIANKMVRKELEAFLIKRDYPHAMQDESVMTMVKHIVDEYLKSKEK